MAVSCCFRVCCASTSCSGSGSRVQSHVDSGLLLLHLRSGVMVDWWSKGWYAEWSYGVDYLSSLQTGLAEQEEGRSSMSVRYVSLAPCSRRNPASACSWSGGTVRHPSRYLPWMGVNHNSLVAALART